MIDLDHITYEELWDKLDEVEEGVPTRRVMAAISHKQGDSVETLAFRNNVSEQTIRNWLKRFIERSIEEAPYDEQRSGRPSKLTEDEREQLFEELNDSPESVGYDRRVWFPRLVLHHLQTTYEVDYSLRHIRRLMRDAGLSWRTTRPTHFEGDPGDAEEFKETVKKTD